MLDLDLTEAMLMLAKARFSPFTKSDFDAFGGIESPNPYIGEYKEWLIIIDGDRVNFENNKTGEGRLFVLTEQF